LPDPVIRASIDDFQQPRAVRRRRGDYSAAGYYLDGFDHASLKSLLLDPFSQDAATVTTACFDYDLDQSVDVRAEVPPRAVLVVDGVFLQVEAIRNLWSLIVYLNVTPDLAARRGIDRDSSWPGASRDDVERCYAERYLPAQALYRAAVDPAAKADIVIDNTDPTAPTVIRGDQLRL